MSERKVIEEKLRKKELEIQTLEEKIKAAKLYIQALQDVLRALDSESAASREGDVTLKPGSAVAKVRELIIGKKMPLHINQLIEMLGKEVTRESRASLTSSLAAYVRRGEIFTRPAPNTFGLAELDHVTEPHPQPVPEPPRGFGRIVERVDPTPHKLDDDVPF
jgi:hypothetical protein